MADLTPPAAPSASPAPQPQAPSSQPSPALVPSFIDQIDSLSPNPTTNEVQKAPEPQAQAPEPPKTPQDAPQEAPKAQEDEDLPRLATTPAKPAAEVKTPVPEADPTTPKGLREALKAAKADLAKFNAEKVELQKQIDAAKRAGAEEATASLKQELETLRQQQSKAEETMRYFDYRNSKEYKEKFQEPLEKAWKEALTDIKGHTYEDENGQTQTVSADTMTQLVNLPTVQASQLATKIFGTAAAEVLAHRREIIRLDRGAKESEATWKAKGSEMTQAQQRQQEERLAKVSQLYHGHAQSLRQSVPELFDRPTDAEEAKYYDKGLAWVEKAFEGKGIPDGLTPEQRQAEIVKAQATVATRAAAFGSLLQRFNSMNAKLTAAEKELASFKTSAPRADGGKTEPAPMAKKEASFDEAFDSFVAKIK